MPVGICQTFRDLDVLECLGKYFRYTQRYLLYRFSNTFNGKIWNHSIQKFTSHNMLNG